MVTDEKRVKALRGIFEWHCRMAYDPDPTKVYVGFRFDQVDAQRVAICLYSDDEAVLDNLIENPPVLG